MKDTEMEDMAAAMPERAREDTSEVRSRRKRG
jgi:hypothetical protein